MADYQKALSIDPDSKDAGFAIAEIFEEQGDTSAALAAYSGVLKKHDDEDDVYVNLIASLTKVLKKDSSNLKYTQARQDALDQFIKRVDAQPNATSWYNLGFVYSDMGRSEEAMAAYRKAIELSPEKMQAHFNLAYLYETSGRWPEARQEYEKTIALDHSNEEAYYNLGNVYAQLKMNQRAIASYQKTINLNPNHLNALVNLSILCFQEKDFENAIKYCDQAMLLGYDAPAGYLSALEAYRKK